MTLYELSKGASSAHGSMAISHRSQLAILLRRGEATIFGTSGRSIGSVIGNNCGQPKDQKLAYLRLQWRQGTRELNHKFRPPKVFWFIEASRYTLSIGFKLNPRIYLMEIDGSNN